VVVSLGVPMSVPVSLSVCLGREPEYERRP
jgi:hypothetical protein